MVVTLMTDKKYSTISLPEKVGGQYWLKLADSRAPSRDLIGIEGAAGQWRLKSNKNVSLLDKDSPGKDKAVIKSTELSLLSVYYLRLEQTGEDACIYTEPVTGDRQTFHKYVIKMDDAELMIGRGDDNDIVFTNRFVSSKHAKIIYRGGRFSVLDRGSANGTFVNEERIHHEKELHPGDMVYVMGFKIIIGDKFLAVNNPDGQVEIKAKALLPYTAQTPAVEEHDDEEEDKEIKYFYR
jgi:S-DNA-T family DNA segregation ATPase FtsK/SpoIIIE